MIRSLALALALGSLTLGGCKKKVDTNLDTVSAEVAPPRVPPPANVTEAVQQMRTNFSRVHFEVDSATLTGTSKEALALNADLMKKYPRLMVEVQGHADERGTTDYNLALGNRRATAVQTYMASVGIPTSRVKTISYGEERPLVEGSSEVAWSQNRRAEFRVTRDDDGSGAESTL